MADKVIIRGGVIFSDSQPDGTGDETLTRDATTGEMGTANVLSGVLSDGQILVGNSSNEATAVTPTGDVTISNTGITSISDDVIVNSDVNSTAGIEFTKLEVLTPSVVPVLDENGFITSSDTTSQELGYSSGLSGPIQDQLNSKQATITGAATSIVTSNLALNRALISNGTGKVDVHSTATTTHLGFISTLASNAQDQLDTKLTVSLASEADGDTLVRIGGAWANFPIGTVGQVFTVDGSGLPSWQNGTSNGLTSGGTTGQILYKVSNTDYDAAWETLDLSKISDITASSSEVNVLDGITSTTNELNYSSGVTSPIQTQLDSKLSRTLSYNAIFVGNGANIATQLGPGVNGQVLTIIGSTPSWQDPTPPGNVSGPVSSTDNAIVRFNGTSGDSIQDSAVLIDDTNNISGVVSLSTGQVSVLNQGVVKLYETGSTNYVGVRASGTMASDYTITLPDSAPSSNTYLKYDGANYVWAAGSGGGGASAFTDLTDVPTSYTGVGGQHVRVKVDETGLEFFTGTVGTVTSVDMTVPSILSVSGNPITSSGTLALTLTNQNANRVFAGPTTGGAATPAFRALVASDIPDLSGTYYLASNPSAFISGNESITLSGDITGSGTTSITTSLGTNVVLDTHIRQSSALSVIGRTTNSTGNVADISAGTDGFVLRRSGTSLGFGTIATAGIGNSQVTYAKIQDSSVGLSILGRSANSSGVYAEITGTADQVLRVNSAGTSLGFGTIANAGLANSSIAFATGTSGTDVNWGSSPVSLGGTATLNIPDASSTARGLVTTGTQTIQGSKTFNVTLNTASSIAYTFAPTQTATGAGQTLTSVLIDGSGVSSTSSPTKRYLRVTDGTMGFTVTNTSVAVGEAIFSVTKTSGSGSTAFSVSNGTTRFAVTQEGRTTINPSVSASLGATLLSLGGTLVCDSVGGSSAIPYNITSTVTAASSTNTLYGQSIATTFACGAFNPTLIGLNYNPTITGTPATHYGLLIQPTAALNGFGTATPTAVIDVAASTTSRASLRIRSGTAPTSPNDGDIWQDGTDLKIYIGGTIKTFTLV